MASKHSEGFGRYVRAVHEQQKLSLQQVVARMSEVSGTDGELSASFGTIRSMTFGAVPGPEKVIGWALATDQDPDQALVEAGYRYLRYVKDHGRVMLGLGSRPAAGAPVAAWERRGGSA